MAEKRMTDGSAALQEKQYRIITVEATQKPADLKLRVAAYARVSSASEDQLNSFAAQNRYYTDLIAGKENWSMVDVYADEGITGTSAEKRPDFQRLLADCRRGLIDRVLVKSISRFARNTKECLEVIRELKSLGIGVYFEKENIDTATMSGEMMTTLFASFAQAESESISGNMRWSYQRKMQSGEFITCKAPFGYRLHSGMLIIDAYEAAVVQQIFTMYLSGKNRAEIARHLDTLHVPVPKGICQWKASTIYHILHNERYTGNALLAKFITTPQFPHRKIRNHGEATQYYLENSHAAIISQDVFFAAQQVARTRNTRGDSLCVDHSFRKRIVCAYCDSLFKRKMTRGKEYWVCNNHFENAKVCPLLPIPTIQIEDTFLRIYWKLKNYVDTLLPPLLRSLQSIQKSRMLWSQDVVELNKQISELSSQNQMLVTLKQRGLVDPDIFISQSNELAEQLRKLKLQKERLLAADGDDTISQTQELLEILEAGPDFLEDFDAELFGELVDKIIVESNERIRFRLKNGLELKETIERTRR